MEKKRHVHADLMIAYAEDPSIVIETLLPDEDGIWCIVKHPRFIENYLYRLHEREFPKTSLSVTDLRQIWFEIEPDTKIEDALLIVANAAIKQYILDNEKESE